MSTLTTYTAALALKGYDALATATLQAAVQEGRRRVLMDRRWSFLEDENATLSTVAGTATVSLATITDLMHIDAVRLSDASGPIPIQWRDAGLIRDLRDTCPETGTPLFWTRKGGSLLFYPTPSRVFTVTVEHTNWPGDVAGTADIIPDKHQDLVVWAAVVPLAYRQRQLAESSAADQYYSKVLFPRAAAQDGLEHRQTSQQIRTGYWGS